MKRLLLICCILSLGSLSCFANTATIKLHNSGHKGVIIINKKMLYPNAIITFDVPAAYVPIDNFSKVRSSFTLPFFQQGERQVSLKFDITTGNDCGYFSRKDVNTTLIKGLPTVCTTHIVSDDGEYNFSDESLIHGTFETLDVSLKQLPVVVKKHVTVFNTLNVPLKFTLDKKDPAVSLNPNCHWPFPNVTISCSVENRIATKLYLNYDAPINVVCPFVT